MKAPWLTDNRWPFQYLTLLGILAFGSSTLTSSTVASEPTDPKATSAQQRASIRYVQVEQAQVYAGPGEDYYPTSIIARGTTVEVYDRTADGWLAIRPPQGSFSWLPAAQGLLMPGGRIVEVTERNAVAWIGSSLGTAKQYRWQVKLDRGEQLAVLGEQNIQDPTTQAKALWYKIAPPNGEFRWIRENATSDEAPVSQEELAQDVQSAEAQSVINTGDEQASQVVQASGEEPIPPANPSGNAAVKNKRSHKRAHPGNDPWESWHAVEFKNGSFSFPGIARMFGMEPPQSLPSGRARDPFDLNVRKSPARTSPSTSIVESDSLGPGNTASPTASSEQLAGRQARGWRDPRQLRQARLQDSTMTDGAALATEPVMMASDDAEYEDAHYADRNDDNRFAGNAGEAYASPDFDAQVMDASLATDQPIGTSVVPAAGPPSSKQDVQSAAWYGVSQAPDAPRRTNPSGTGDLNQLQLQLSEMVAGPEHTWDLAPLAVRARHFVEHGATAVERGEARLLLERIESFAQVSQQSSQLGMSLPPASVPGQPVAAASTKPAALATRPVAPGETQQFDATGWLVPVHSNGRDMPTHALTNDTGKIIVYLTGAPGINLARFESQQVGVFGLRGYLPQLKANHVQVERTVRLR